jgi:pyridoxal phosphate enzyme (YggS family)
MPVQKQAFTELKNYLNEKGVTLVAVSKTKPIADIQELYNLGHRDFGENYVQELVDKAAQLPKDIRWHFIGHLQRNKVKYIAPFVHLIHGVDSMKLLNEINKEAAKNNRLIHCLLQVHIAEEETKFGFDEQELSDLLMSLASDSLNNIELCGLMGMASFTSNTEKIQSEFRHLKSLFDKITFSDTGLSNHFTVLSMGMSSDYKLAIEEGSNMVRIGSLIFGERI